MSEREDSEKKQSACSKSGEREMRWDAVEAAGAEIKKKRRTRETRVCISGSSSVVQDMLITVHLQVSSSFLSLASSLSYTYIHFGFYRNRRVRKREEIYKDDKAKCGGWRTALVHLHRVP